MPGENAKIGDLEQTVAELRNEIQSLRAGATDWRVNDDISAPRPEYDSGSGPQINEPFPSSVYSVEPPTQQLPPTNNDPRQYAYNQGFRPARPWAVEPPAFAVPTPVDHYIPVPVVVETSPCWHDCGVYAGPICDPYFPPAIGQFSFWFGDNGNYRHKHKH